MTFNDNSIECKGCEKPAEQCCQTITSLAQIANQLASVAETGSYDSVASHSSRPEVVFVEDEQAAATALNSSQMQIEIQSSNYQYPAQIEVTQTSENAASGTHFTVDPFAMEVDGEIPAMPILPVIDAQKLTEQVIARQSAGDHHAWKLMASNSGASGDSASGPENSDHDNSTNDQSKPSWVETEVVAASEKTNGFEDCFYAQPGQVIKVDGNQGFDHIDLRSYSIDDATFQPGAILLHTNTDPTLLPEGEDAPQPITIRHRGIEFAVFSGDVLVDL